MNNRLGLRASVIAALASVVTVSLLAVTGALSIGQGDSPVIYAAVNPNDGTLRIISGPSAIKKNEALLYWNQTGPQGIQGPQGIPGEQGLPGESAATAPIIWSGGPSQHGIGATSWTRYLTDVVELNTAADYLTVDPSGTITIQKPGFYRVNFHTISHSSTSGTEQFWTKIVRNGQLIHAGALLSAGGSGWMSNTADLISQFYSGDTIEIYIMPPTAYSYAYHMYDNLGHSRLQVQFIGEL